MRTVEFVDGQPTVSEIDDPTPAANQLLVEMASAGLNGADIAQAAGRYPPPPGAPTTPGLELAGRVVGAGAACRRFVVGDTVMAVVQGGGQAELCLVDEPLAMPVPPALDLSVAGGFPEVFATAHDAVFTQAELRMGERLCVHGAAGGVGTAAVQLAVAAGCNVTATVRNEASRSIVADLGARVIAPDDTVEGGPYDVILELVGAPNWPANIEALDTQGRIVVIGVGAGPTIELNLLALMGKRARILASTLRARPLEQRATVARLLERHVLPLVTAGRLTVPVAQSFPLADAPAAYAAFTTSGKFGKVLLVP